MKKTIDIEMDLYNILNGDSEIIYNASSIIYKLKGILVRRVWHTIGMRTWSQIEGG